MLHFWYFFILFINKPALMVSRHTYIGLLHEMLTRHLKVTTQKLIEVTKGGNLMKHCKLLFSENMHSDWLKLIMWFSTSNHKGFFPEYLYFYETGSKCLFAAINLEEIDGDRQRENICYCYCPDWGFRGLN